MTAPAVPPLPEPEQHPAGTYPYPPPPGWPPNAAWPPPPPEPPPAQHPRSPSGRRDQPIAATASLVFGILGCGVLLLDVPAGDFMAMVGINCVAFLFGLIAANYGRDAIHSAQRGIATAGLILGILAALVGGIWFGQHGGEIQNSSQYHTQSNQ